jgi:hypothetical protein
LRFLLPNSSGTFLSANEDPTGTLAEVEKKIARATMIPRKHGEVLHNICICMPHVVFQSDGRQVAEALIDF